MVQEIFEFFCVMCTARDSRVASKNGIIKKLLIYKIII